MPISKPTQTTYRPRILPGVTVLAGLGEGEGYASAWLNGVRTVGTYTGSPTWERGLYGPQLSGFGASSYIDWAQSAVAVTYPLWAVVMFVNSSSSQQVMAGWSSTSDAFGAATLRVNNASIANTVAWRLRNNAGGTSVVAALNASTNDGLPHVAMGVSFSDTDHRIYFDGQPGITATTSVGSLTNNTWCIGALHNSSVTLPTVGSILFTAGGMGITPNPYAVYQDLISGRFRSIRPRRRRNLFAFSASTAPFFRRTLYDRVGSRGVA